jgi:hypothetical protein
MDDAVDQVSIESADDSLLTSAETADDGWMHAHAEIRTLSTLLQLPMMRSIMQIRRGLECRP